MAASGDRTIVVFGVTGRQGGAVARHLIADGWKVRGVTRDPAAPKARKQAVLGVELVKADMAHRESLDAAVAGAYGVYSVQNPMISGFDAEVLQGKAVADAAKVAGVQHVVYGAAGIGRPTGIPSWDTKVEVEEHMRGLGLPLTVLRPNAFMELMTDKAYYPNVAIWHVMVRLMGGERNVPWLAVDDVGAVAARVFAAPERFLGEVIPLASEVKTLNETRETWSDVYGKPPAKFPMPVFVFERIAGYAGKDLPVMWRWLKNNSIPEDTELTRAIHPHALSVRDWMQLKKIESKAA